MPVHEMEQILLLPVDGPQLRPLPEVDPAHEMVGMVHYHGHPIRPVRLHDEALPESARVLALGHEIVPVHDLLVQVSAHCVAMPAQAIVQSLPWYAIVQQYPPRGTVLGYGNAVLVLEKGPLPVAVYEVVLELEIVQPVQVHEARVELHFGLV